MSSRFAGWVYVLGAASLLGGCGKAEGAGEPIPRTELAARASSLFCGSLANCCKTSGLAFDSASCQAAQAARIEKSLADELEQRVTYDAQAAGECLAELSTALHCGDVRNDPAACDRIFVGQVALGMPCNSRQECAPVSGQELGCQSVGDGSVRVCVARAREVPLRGKAGDLCSNSCADPETCLLVETPGPGNVPTPARNQVACYRTDNLYCDGARCSPLLAEGQRCDDFAACGGSTFCSSRTGQCTAPQPDGAPCDGDGECRSGTCGDAPDVAAPSSGPVCVAGVREAECSQSFMEPGPVEPAPSSGAGSPGTSGPGPGR